MRTLCEVRNFASQKFRLTPVTSGVDVIALLGNALSWSEAISAKSIAY